MLYFHDGKKVIFVHGCYWHRHGCKKTTTPTSNFQFWQKKFKENVERDQRPLEALSDLGWETLVIWECETQDTTRLVDQLSHFFRNDQ